MAQQQTSQAPTPVSFDDISLDHLSFNETFRVTRGSASQVVIGLRNMLQKLSTPENDYQRSIYPQLSSAINRLVNEYTSTFLSVTEPVEKQVFGANLNGFRNDGSLYRSVNSGINRSLTYGYSQFGQLVRVLTNRLRFVVKRDPQSVERYKKSDNEMSAYKKLQQSADSYLNVVTEVTESWGKTVEEARKTHGVQRETTNNRPSQKQYEGRTNQSQGRQNQSQGRQKQYEGRTSNSQGRQNQYEGRTSNSQGRTNQSQGITSNNQESWTTVSRSSRGGHGGTRYTRTQQAQNL